MPPEYFFSKPQASTVSFNDKELPNGLSFSIISRRDKISVAKNKKLNSPVGTKYYID
jgi:hypothetical protein